MRSSPATRRAASAGSAPAAQRLADAPGARSRADASGDARAGDAASRTGSRTGDAPGPTCRRHRDPDLEAGHRPRRGARPSSTSCAPGCSRWASGRPSSRTAWASYCGVRHAVFMTNGTVALEALLRALDIGAGRRGRHRQLHVQRDGERHPAGRRAAGLRRHPRGRLLHGSGAGRGGDHAAHEGDHAGPSVRPDGRHGAARGDRRTDTGSRSSRTRRRRTGRRTAGRRAGQFGPAMFSLYATKNLMTGEGGFATTDDDAVADRLRLYRNHGMRVRYHHDALGTNFKPTDIGGRARAGAARPPRRTAGPATAQRRAPWRGPPGLPHAERPRGPRARLAPVHDALPRRA